MGSNAIVSLKASLLLVSVLLSSCGLLTPQGPTEVARGEYYAAGKPAFDSFFIQLHDLQVQLLSAPEELKRARINLTKAVGLTADASDESLSARLRQELQKLQNQGLRVRLDVPESAAPDASATLHTNDNPTSSPLRTRLPEEATRLVRSRNRMQETRAQLEKLRVKGIELEANVDAEFRVEGPWKRDEVRRNLADGQKLITLMIARAQEVQEQDRKLLQLVASSVTNDPNLGKVTATVPPPVEEPAKPAKRAPGRGFRPATTGAPRPAPAAPKPAAAPRSEEASPAPKPVQGSAPAEIEP
jgi:hypothetical protein